MIRAAHRMSRLFDPRRPKCLTDEQRVRISRNEEIVQLCDRRDALQESIHKEFRFLYRAQGESVYDEYQETKRAFERLQKAQERKLMKEIQAGV